MQSEIRLAGALSLDGDGIVQARGTPAGRHLAQCTGITYPLPGSLMPYTL